MKKLHVWVQSRYEPGHKQQKCVFCGAVRTDFQIGVKYATKYGPWRLNGKRQPYCPPKEAK